MNILWLRPSKGDHISVRRERIAEKLEASGFDVHIQDASGTDLFGAVWTALTGDFDVIAGNVRVGLYAGFPLAKLLRIPFLGDVSDPISDIDYLPGPLFRFFRWYEWQVLQRADATVFVYESSYRTARSLGIDTAVNLPNAVDVEMFDHPDPEAVSTARDILVDAGVDVEKPIAIYLGVFSERYCIREILGAAEFVTDWEFVFLGEGNLRDEVAEAAESLENVAYPGAFEYHLMPGFLSHADVGFCFKNAEQPLKLKEYGAASLPTIARPGALEQWYDEDELRFVEPNPQAIAKVLAEFASDEETRRELGKCLRKRVTEYTWSDIADGYRRLFEDLDDDSR